MMKRAVPAMSQPGPGTTAMQGPPPARALTPTPSESSLLSSGTQVTTHTANSSRGRSTLKPGWYVHDPYRQHEHEPSSTAPTDRFRRPPALSTISGVATTGGAESRSSVVAPPPICSSTNVTATVRGWVEDQTYQSLADVPLVEEEEEERQKEPQDGGEEEVDDATAVDGGEDVVSLSLASNSRAGSFLSPTGSWLAAPSEGQYRRFPSPGSPFSQHSICVRCSVGFNATGGASHHQPVGPAPAYPRHVRSASGDSDMTSLSLGTSSVASFSRNYADFCRLCTSVVSMAGGNLAAGGSAPHQRSRVSSYAPTFDGSSECSFPFPCPPTGAGTVGEVEGDSYRTGVSSPASYSSFSIPPQAWVETKEPVMSLSSSPPSASPGATSTADTSTTAFSGGGFGPASSKYAYGTDPSLVAATHQLSKLAPAGSVGRANSAELDTLSCASSMTTVTTASSLIRKFALPYGTLHRKLFRKVSFIPYPSKAFVSVGPPKTFRKENLIRIFIGQLPYQVTDMQLGWLCSTFGNGAAVYYPERITKSDASRTTKVPTGCVHAYCHPDDVKDLMEGLHKRLLIDDTGVWCARTPEEQDALTSYCEAMKKDRKVRIHDRPYGALVVQYAASHQNRPRTPGSSSNSGATPSPGTTHQQHLPRPRSTSSASSALKNKRKKSRSQKKVKGQQNNA